MAQRVENLPALQETWVPSLGWEDHLEKELLTHASFLAYSPWGRKESDMTEPLTLSLFISLGASGLNCYMPNLSLWRAGFSRCGA